MLRFEEWLLDQQERHDRIGDLARILVTADMVPKPAGRNTNAHKNWADIVTELANPGHIATFNEAWQEYLLERKAAGESSTP